MESRTKRTLVKSAPELWELASDQARMEAWTAWVVGTESPVGIEVIDSDSERILAWRSADSGRYARIAIELSESGFGTLVRVTAQHSHPDPGVALAALEGMLDDLGAPERRPFTRA